MENKNLRERYRDMSYERRPIAGAEAMASPSPAAEGSPQPAKKSRSMKIWLLPALFLAVASAGYGAFYYKNHQSPAIPASVKSATTLPIYYPQKLPEGYSLDENSFELRGDVLSYSATSTNNQKLLFTIQSRPATFDFPTFYQQGLSNTEQFSTINGQAAIGLAQKKLVGSMVTGKSWLLLSADNSDLTSEDFKLVLTNLKLSI